MEFRQFGKTRKIAHCRCINAFSFECLYDNCDEGIGTQRGKCGEVRLRGARQAAWRRSVREVRHRWRPTIEAPRWRAATGDVARRGGGRPSHAPRWRAATGDVARRREPGGPAAKHRALPQRDRMANGPGNGTRAVSTATGRARERGSGEGELFRY